MHGVAIKSAMILARVLRKLPAQIALRPRTRMTGPRDPTTSDKLHKPKIGCEDLFT